MQRDRSTEKISDFRSDQFIKGLKLAGMHATRDCGHWPLTAYYVVIDASSTRPPLYVGTPDWSTFVREGRSSAGIDYIGAAQRQKIYPG